MTLRSGSAPTSRGALLDLEHRSARHRTAWLLLVSAAMLAGALGLEPRGFARPQKASSPAGTALRDRSSWLPEHTKRQVALTIEAQAQLQENRPATLWVPIPQNDADQIVRDLEIEGEGGAVEIGLPDQSGHNRFVRVTGDGTKRLRVTVRSVVERRVHRTDENWLAEPAPLASRSSLPPALEPWLGARRLIPLDAEIRARAAKLAPKSTDTVAIARAAYRWVLEHMRYDKSRPGWGRGDARWACESGFGNCTDFHALFLALVRARSIPARFHMGIALEKRPGEHTVHGYHCWASFFAPGIGWVPVDISEADQHPERARFNFGNLSADRIELTRGRDLILPGQRDPEPLNFVSGAHLEIDGAPRTDKVRYRVRTIDLGGN